MFARRRPLLRAAVVGGGAYAIGKRSAQHADQQSAAQADQNTGTSTPPQGSPGGGAGSGAAEPSVSDQLAQLSQLHQQGSLSDSEFAAAKARLLGT